MPTTDPARLESSTRSLLTALKAIEWSRVKTGASPARLCPSCNCEKSRGHAPACAVGNAIAQAEAVLPRPPAAGREDGPVASVLPRWARAPAKCAIWLLWTFEAAIGLSGTHLPHDMDVASLLLSCVTIAFYWRIVGRGTDSPAGPIAPQRGLGSKG